MKSTPKFTLTTIIEGYFLSTQSRRLSEYTVRDYAYTYLLLREYHGNSTIFAEITKDDIGRFLAARGKVPALIL